MEIVRSVCLYVSISICHLQVSTIGDDNVGAALFNLAEQRRRGL